MLASTTVRIVTQTVQCDTYAPSRDEAKDYRREDEDEAVLMDTGEEFANATGEEHRSAEDGERAHHPENWLKS
jgi:hypothetical protein